MLTFVLVVVFVFVGVVNDVYSHTVVVVCMLCLVRWLRCVSTVVVGAHITSYVVVIARVVVVVVVVHAICIAVGDIVCIACGVGVGVGGGVVIIAVFDECG